jgi:tripartite-type tricarboxylate transporter receptor subunit TctC
LKPSALTLPSLSPREAVGRVGERRSGDAPSPPRASRAWGGESPWHRIVLLTSVVCAAATCFTGSVPAQPSYPTRNVEIIVSYGPGGSTDIVARLVAQKLQERLGQSFVVLNRPGAGGVIGMQTAMRAAPDGHTLYNSYTAEAVIVPHMSKNKYSVIDDFEPIAITGLVPVVLMVSKTVKAENLKDFIEEMRANPGKYSYGGGNGSPPHVFGAWMNKLKGLTLTHVPYRGGAQGINDVIGGHIDMFYGGVAAGKAAIDSGGVRALAVTGDKRSTALPNVPTFKEAGVPEFDLASWTVLLAPKGTPADILGVLRKETLAALSDPALREAMARQGVEPGESPDVRAFLVDQSAKFGRAVHELGITMGQ